MMKDHLREVVKKELDAVEGQTQEQQASHFRLSYLHPQPIHPTQLQESMILIMLLLWAQWKKSVMHSKIEEKI